MRSRVQVTELTPDNLWKELDSPRPLLSLLAPLIREDVHMVHTSFFLAETLCVLVSLDYFYAQGIRVLNSDFRSSRLSARVSREIEDERLSLALVPNLLRSEVSIYSPGYKDSSEMLAHSLLFMGKNVQEFRNVIESQLSDPFQGASGFFEDCAARMLKLRTLELDSMYSWPIPFIENHCPIFTPAILPMIAKYCSKLQHLTSYVDTHFDEPWLSPRFTLEPGRFGHLERIDFGASPLTDGGISKSAICRNRVLPETCKVDWSSNVLIPARLEGISRHRT
ncbi:hypothetical protein ACEPAI_1893 [Sanghuangporus weigelae]